MEKLLHDIPEACEILSIGRTKLYAEAKAGRITIVKAGEKSLIPHASLEQYVEARIAEAANKVAA